MLHDAEAFFGKGAEGLGKVIEKAFKENGRPVGYIKGQEAAGAITVGLIYGDGTLVMKNGEIAGACSGRARRSASTSAPTPRRCSCWSTT